MGTECCYISRRCDIGDTGKVRSFERPVEMSLPIMGTVVEEMCPHH